MPALIGWLLGALETRIGSIVISALISLGFSFVTYKFTVAPLKAFLIQQLAGAPGQLLGIIGFLGIDVACTMILSAIATRWAVQGASHLVRSPKAAP